MPQQVITASGALRALIGSGSWTFTGKNNGSLTDISMNAEEYDDMGTDDWTAHAYYTIPAAGKYLFGAYLIHSGATGTGSCTGGLLRRDSGGTLITTLCTQTSFALNEKFTMVGITTMNASDRLVVQTQNGATGSAGTVAGRAFVVRIA